MTMMTTTEAVVAVLTAEEIEAQNKKDKKVIEYQKRQIND